MPIDHQPRPPLLVTDPLDLGPEAEQMERQIRAGLRVPPTSFELPNVRADVREMAQRHSRELREATRSEFPQMEVYSNPVIASGEDARRMRNYLRRGQAQMEEAHLRMVGPPQPTQEDRIRVPEIGTLYQGPTIRLSDIWTRRFDLIERTVGKVQATVQCILAAIQAQVHPKPEKPAEEPPKGRYERLKSDLPEL
jgi:hypothetical protein